ncbi:MAG: TerB family tellurite resistance protein [Polaromonas sp.]|uniref:TerB family tellurite resistance protein n=1 Tax=Polaromonas sp. TaxID=1869339 RepID=UPI0027330A6D|nr:TerB family tellurite resistance protein [Polaromonas sp.]MDP2818656.1 TerB family tellurite resistance protein [Polaromonas sp.]
MRSYPQNSPRAAARIVALAILSDGNMCKTELDMLDHLNAHEELGLSKDEFHAVVHTFCEDLLAAAHSIWGDMCRVDPKTLTELMAEINDPELRRKLVGLCAAVVEADGHVAEGESIVLGAAVEHWGLEHAMLKAPGGA